MDEYAVNVKLFFTTYKEISRKKGILTLAEKEILEKKLRKFFECPVCCNYIKPPVATCDNGHLICFLCWAKCYNCPFCRIPKSNIQIQALNYLYKLIPFQCDYEGCSLIAPGSVINKHQNVCGYYRLKCPLEHNFKCKWEGTWSKIQEHLHKGHDSNVYFTDSVIIQIDLLRLGDKYRFLLVYGGNIFLLDFEIDKRIPIAQFNVSVTRFDARKYRYQLEIFDARYVYTSCVSSSVNDPNVGIIRIPINNVITDAGKLRFRYRILKCFW